MSNRIRLIPTLLALFMLAGAALPAVAQVAEEPVKRPAPSIGDPAPAGTPERAAQLVQLGLSSDPGPEPDPETVWVRNGRRYTIQKIGLEWCLPPMNGRDGWVQPHHMVNMDAELYQMSDSHAWYFMEIPSIERPVPKYRTDATGRKIKIKKRSQEETDKMRVLRNEFDTVIPAKSSIVVGFADSSAGLPTGGSWRNSPAIADMNGDGNLDIVAPPQRAAEQNFPTIFLGDGKGGWAVWESVRWPEKPFNYGSASAGDLNRDGKMDLVFGSHLDKVRAMLGDGKGGFSDANEGLPGSYHTRRARLADVDRDGDLDILALTEGPTRMSLSTGTGTGLPLLVFLNDGKAASWTQSVVAPSERQLGGDWLHTGDFNGDKRLDIVASSIVVSGTDTMWLGQAKPATFEPFGRGFLPFRSVYHANTVGSFSQKNREDVIAAFSRAYPEDVDPDIVPYPENVNVVGIERIWWDGKKFDRAPILRGNLKTVIRAIGAGDVDGDGNLDIVYLDDARVELVLLLGNGKGTFSQGRIDAPGLPPRRAYDLELVDVDNDKRKDLVILFESDESQANGLIKVYLNKGKVKDAS